MVLFKLWDLHCHTALDVKPKTVTPHPLQNETKTGPEVCWEKSDSLLHHKHTNYVRQTQLLFPAAHYDFSTERERSLYKSIKTIQLQRLPIKTWRMTCSLTDVNNLNTCRLRSVGSLTGGAAQMKLLINASHQTNEFRSFLRERQSSSPISNHSSPERLLTCV